MSQIVLQRYISQDVLKKQSIFSHRSQSRDGCPSSSIQCFIHKTDHLLLGGTRVLVTFPPEAKGFQVLVTSQVSHATEGQADQATTVHMHNGLFPIVQGKEIHIHQSYPTPTPSGRPEASPPFLGKLSGTRHG